MTAASMIILILFYNVYGMKRQKRFKNCQFLCDSWGILEKTTSSVSCTLIQFCVQVPIEGTANVFGSEMACSQTKPEGHN